MADPAPVIPIESRRRRAPRPAWSLDPPPALARKLGRLSPAACSAGLLLALAMGDRRDATLADDDQTLAKIVRLPLKEWQAVRDELRDFVAVEGSRLTYPDMQEALLRREMQRRCGRLGGHVAALNARAAAAALNPARSKADDEALARYMAIVAAAEEAKVDAEAAYYRATDREPPRNDNRDRTPPDRDPEAWALGRVAARLKGAAALILPAAPVAKGALLARFPALKALQDEERAGFVDMLAALTLGEAGWRLFIGARWGSPEPAQQAA